MTKQIEERRAPSAAERGLWIFYGFFLGSLLWIGFIFYGLQMLRCLSITEGC